MERGCEYGYDGPALATHAATMVAKVWRRDEGRRKKARLLLSSNALATPLSSVLETNLARGMTVTTKRPRSTTPPASSDGVPTTNSRPLIVVPTQKTKRARPVLPASEVVQVESHGEYRLPLADADVRYKPGFVGEDDANRWYDQLSTLDGCESLSLLDPRIPS